MHLHIMIVYIMIKIVIPFLEYLSRSILKMQFFNCVFLLAFDICASSSDIADLGFIHVVAYLVNCRLILKPIISIIQCDFVQTRILSDSICVFFHLIINVRRKIRSIINFWFKLSRISIKKFANLFLDLAIVTSVILTMHTYKASYFR